MIGRLAELWLTQGYREYDFDEAVDHHRRGSSGCPRTATP
jgi:hypothetical protein